MTIRAECQCGRLHVEMAGAPDAVVSCHCIACQRRTGSPFAVLAHYQEARVVVGGEARCYVRVTDDGYRYETFFCPECGSTVYAKPGRYPGLISVAVGAIGDPGFPAPVRSIWEVSMHHWVEIPGDVEHFPRSRIST